MFSRNFLSILIFLFFLVFFLYPVSTVFLRAFFFEGQFTTTNFELFLLDSQSLPNFFHSCFVAFTVALLSVFFGTFLAFLFSGYRFLGKGFLEVCLIAPFFLPPFIGVIGLKSLFGRFGTVNIFLMDAKILSQPIDFFEPGTVSGVIILQALHLYPLVYLGVRGVLQKIPMELIEAGILCGADRKKRFMRILLPLCIPTALSGGLLSFIGSLTDVGTPLLFEWRRSVAVQVFASIIDLPKQGSGYALTLLVAVFVAVLFFLAYYIERRFPSAADPKLHKAIPINAIKTVSERLAVFFAAALCIGGIIPHLSLLLVSFSDRWFMSALPQSYSIESYKEVFFHPLTSTSFLYSVCLSLAAGALAVFIGFAIAHSSNQQGIGRFGNILSRINDSLSMIPMAVPGIVLAFGLAVGFASTPIDAKENPTILLILAYTIRKLPYAVRFCHSSILQVPKSYLEAARMAGAKWYSIVIRILFPLHRPAIVSVAVVVFLTSMVEVSDSLILPLEEKYFPISKTLYALQGRMDGASLSAAFAVLIMFTVLVGFFIVARLQNKKISELLRG